MKNQFLALVFGGILFLLYNANVPYEALQHFDEFKNNHPSKIEAPYNDKTDSKIIIDTSEIQHPQAAVFMKEINSL